MPRRFLPAFLVAVSVVFGLAVTLPGSATTAPGLRLAFFPPTWDGVEVFRAIILGGAKPISAIPVPGAWLIHLDPGQSDSIPGALVTSAGPFIRFATAACLTPTDRQ